MTVLRRYQIEEALDRLSDSEGLEMQVKLTALTMIRQRGRDDLLGVFVVPADASEVLLLSGMLLNFVVHYYRLIMAGHYSSVRDCLDDCQHYCRFKYTL